MGYSLDDCLLTCGEWEAFRKESNISERNAGPLAHIETLRDTLRFVLKDDGMLPRATSECREVIKMTLLNG